MRYLNRLRLSSRKAGCANKLTRHAAGEYLVRLPFLSAPKCFGAMIGSPMRCCWPRNRRRELRHDCKNELAGRLTRLDVPMHAGRVSHRENAGDRDLQRAVGRAAHDLRYAVLPGFGVRIDVAEMQTGEGLRPWQDTFTDILKRLTLGLTDADDVPKLTHHVEGAVEHGRAK